MRLEETCKPGTLLNLYSVSTASVGRVVGFGMLSAVDNLYILRHPIILFLILSAGLSVSGCLSEGPFAQKAHT